MSLARFHGRNAKTWKAKVKTLAAKSRRVHLLMNTNRDDEGPVNALQLQLALEETGLVVRGPSSTFTA